jgi:hypothetical protein
MGFDFFRHPIVHLEKYWKPGQQMLHTIQTSGTLLNDDWCRFFKQHNFLVGLSVDGPKEMHDAYRVNKGGAGSSDQVMRGWEGAAPPRSGCQYPVHDSRRECRSPGRGVPVLPGPVTRQLHAVHPHRGADHRGFPPSCKFGVGRTVRIGATSLHAARQPGHRAVGQRRTVRPFPVGAWDVSSVLCQEFPQIFGALPAKQEF